MLPPPPGLCPWLRTPEVPVSGPGWSWVLRMRNTRSIKHSVFEGLIMEMLPQPSGLCASLLTPELPVSGPIW